MNSCDHNNHGGSSGGAGGAGTAAGMAIMVIVLLICLFIAGCLYVVRTLCAHPRNYFLWAFTMVFLTFGALACFAQGLDAISNGVTAASWFLAVMTAFAVSTYHDVMLREPFDKDVFMNEVLPRPWSLLAA